MNAAADTIESPQSAARRLAADPIRRGYRPEALHEYQLADGSPWCWRIRCKHPATSEKWIRPMHRTASGFTLGEPTPPPEGKPPYHLPELVAAPFNTVVLIVEGEKCADALAKLGMLATTSGSADSAEAADWTPLRGRSVTVWPDHDAAGQRYGETVAAKLRTLGAQVNVIDTTALGLRDKGDAVDWLAMHANATAADVVALPKLEPAEAHAPQLLPDPLPSVQPFEAAMLPDSLRDWCTDAAEGLGVPLDFLAVPAVVACAAAIGRAVAVRPKLQDRWIERAILWGAVIGRPSAGKSPALAPARRMLARLEADAAKAHTEALRDFNADQAMAAVSVENAKQALRAAIKRRDTAKAEALARDATAPELEAPQEPRIVVADATVEKLGELLNANPRGLLMVRDELTGWLASLDREGHECDRAFWLECWNGTGPFVVDRIGRGTVRIEACAVSVLGGIQPGKLAEYVRGAVRGGMGDDGLMQRFQLPVYPDLPASWRYQDRSPSAAAEWQAQAIFERLRAITAASVGATMADGFDLPWLPLDDDARTLWIEWQEQLMPRLRSGTEPAHMESHLAKFPSLACRLALVLHLADAEGGPVTGEAMARALDWCGYLESHARRIYAPLADGGLRAAHALLRKRTELPDVFTARDVYRKGWAGLDVDTTADAIDVLAEYGHVIELPPEPGAGRPSARYAWGASP